MALTKQSILLALIFVFGGWASLAASRSLLESPSMHERHEHWMTLYGRVYKDASERQRRFEMRTWSALTPFNRSNGKPYKVGVNQFADLTIEEFKASRNRFKSHMGSTDGASFKV
ncbi:hypothetical protein CRG98_036890 [Punica granatum]|uniref:Cathepsin propeptide inhibitor domain-containing protein n=1 Tax=Punica granatum TaxID=22663 RepID=A0A2I0IFK6_PUNGR|nr:hypothetical protein CRG98_036890 [Punica granatum]